MLLEGIEKGAGETAEGNKVPPVWPSREERAHLPAPSKGPGLAEKVGVTSPCQHSVDIIYSLSVSLSVCHSFFCAPAQLEGFIFGLVVVRPALCVQVVRMN